MISVHVIWPLFWMAVIIMGMNFRHRRRMERMRLQYQHGQQPSSAGLSGTERRELEDLRQRVRVLERIATDKSSRLADEIESLRD